jgi:peptide/nickel transport system substrate-binding protein
VGYAAIALIGLAAVVLIAWIAVSALQPGGSESPTPTPSPTQTPFASPTEPPPLVPRGPASDALEFIDVEASGAPGALVSGSIDYCLTPITPDQAQTLRNDSRITLSVAPSQINAILFNPAPAPEGGFNPFASREMRFAMQYLIDRGGIAQTAQKGFGIPIYTSIFPEHPSYGVIEPTVAGFNISFDPQKADALINDAMVSAGARKVAGKWTYGNRQIQVTAVSADNIPEFGPIVAQLASELEKQGFEVRTVHAQTGSQNPMYYSDPSDLEWSFGATGAVFYGASRYEDAFFFTPPEGENWSYSDPEMERFEEMQQNYSSMQEWEDANRLVASEGINQSVCIWVTASNSIFASRTEVQGLTFDRFVGLRSLGNAREASVPGNPTLKIGRELSASPGRSWNPFVIEDINQMDVVNTIHDPATWSSPADLATQPFRWGYSIRTAGPNGTLAVPSDAVAWDYAEQKWAPAGEGKTARSKVTYDLSNYIGAKWHDRTQITWADVLYFTASAWDLSSNPAKSDYSYRDLKSYFAPLKAIRINGTSLETYVDTWSFDDAQFVGFSGLYRRIAPWNEYAAMDALVYGDGEFVYSEDLAPAGSEAPAISLLNATHALAILDRMDSLEYAQVAAFTTVADTPYASEAELRSRAESARSWYYIHGTLIISDGPFYVDKFDAETSKFYLQAFRAPSYPFSKGKWLPDP